MGAKRGFGRWKIKESSKAYVWIHRRHKGLGKNQDCEALDKLTSFSAFFLFQICTLKILKFFSILQQQLKQGDVGDRSS